RVLASARPGQHVRCAGSDIARGETALLVGTVIDAAAWGMLASLGSATVAVRQQPQVAILATGEELVEVGAVLRPGQIRDSNSFTLDGLVRRTGAATRQRLRVGDDVP